MNGNNVNLQNKNDSEKLRNYGEYLLQLWNNKKFIAVSVIFFTLVSISISMFLPKYFRATSNLVPGFDKNGVSALSGLGGLSSLVGVGLGGGSLEQLFPTIVRSETVMFDVIKNKYKTVKFADSVDLIQYWGINEESQIRNFEIAYKKLDGNLDVSIDLRTGVVTVSALMEEPQLAADVVNRIVTRLDQWIRFTRISTASDERKWIEKRLNEVQIELGNAEIRLKNFQLKNRQVGNSPDLLLEQQRLSRDVEINFSVFVELKKRQEIAKIEEIKNIPATTILDIGRPSAVKEKPQRTLIAMVTCLTSLLFSCSYVILRFKYGKVILSRFQDLKSILKTK